MSKQKKIELDHKDKEILASILDIDVNLAATSEATTSIELESRTESIELGDSLKLLKRQR